MKALTVSEKFTLIRQHGESISRVNMAVSAPMPYMLTNDGRTLIERIATLDLLPPPSDDNRPSVQ